MYIHVRKKVSNYDSVSGEKGQNLCFMFYTVLDLASTLRIFFESDFSFEFMSTYIKKFRI